MPKKRVYTVTHVTKKPSLFQTAIPFDITVNGKVVATVVRPQGIWRTCENCGENTQNVLEFQDENAKWVKIILCDKCGNELL
jgi:hypothetical protein